MCSKLKAATPPPPAPEPPPATEPAATAVPEWAAAAPPVAAPPPTPAPVAAVPVAPTVPPAPKPKPAAPPPARAVAKPAVPKPAPAPKPAKPAGAKSALPLPLILIGVAGLLVVLLVVRLVMPKKGAAPPESPGTATTEVIPPSTPPATAVEPPPATPATGTTSSGGPAATEAPAPAPERPEVRPSVPPPAPVVTKPVATTPVIAAPKPAAGATAMIKVSTEPAGAQVTIDGVRQGQPTNATYHVTPGSHTLVIEKSGYFSQDMPVADLKGGETRPAGISLKAVPPTAAGAGGEGTIEIRVTPSSHIFVNGTMVRSDATQATLRLPVGAYTVRAENKTFGSQEWHRDLKADAPVKIDYDFAVASMGRLRVTSSGHNGARVTVDGQDTGLTTPCTVDKLTAGPHAVSVTLEGFEGAPQTASVKAGAVTELNVKLAKSRKKK